MLSRTARRAQHFVDYMRVNRNFRNPEILRKARRRPPLLSCLSCCARALLPLYVSVQRRCGAVGPMPAVAA